ncbi:MAG: T9SS C-terminal target domain-containing protein [Bacteroidetes bacterium]|nr:MAG: T9SS C-terminal target domain-containing protein [Bacteroidota bacterium]MBL1145067.1 T9SS C-terminal target domain-containing protein [Bacteroidota bacterium]MCB0803587.1 Omp28-related outer membrane protein [Flavobacteriales bacterium]NOG57864.1 Omp28-related outer membrane protein [Bacteroidota bacterium]
MNKKLTISILSGVLLFLAPSVKAQNPDAAVIDIPMNDVYAAGIPKDVNVIFKNAGTASFNGITINWSDDGGTTVNAYPLNGFPFAAGGSPLTLSHNVKITFTNPGTYTELMVWTSMPGGITDVNTSNDTMRKQIFVNNGISVTRNVLIEEFTTAPCGFCPEGAYFLENILNANPSVIGVGIHAGFGTDAMTIPEHSILASAFTSSAPSAAIDRTKFVGEQKVAISRSIWGSRTNLRKTVISPLGIQINGTYNSTTRTATVTVNANFADFALPGDIRLGLYVVEDSVIGSGSGYNQRNYFNTGSSSHPYYGKGDPIINYPHRHVVRAVYPINNPWGDNAVIPQSPQMNASYSKTYTFQVSNNWDSDKISFVAFAAYYGSSVEERQIINAAEVKMNEMATGLEKTLSENTEIAVFPNPASEYTYIKLNLNSAEFVEIELLDLTGKLVLSKNFGVLGKGAQTLNIDINGFKSGIYFFRIGIGQQKIMKKISVLK